MPGPLGCPQEYRAAFHWRGGGRVYGTVLLDELESVEWQRTANEASEAKVVLARQAMSPDCCEMVGGRVLPDGRVVGGVEPWIHELTLYRDAELVWQGPVVRTVESREGFTIEAMDVTGWLDRVINTWRISFKDKAEPDKYRVKGPVTTIAHTILKLNLGMSSLSPKMGETRESVWGRMFRRARRWFGGGRAAVGAWAADPADDWAGILNYVVERETKKAIRFEKDGSSNTAIWAEYVGTILRELVKRGLLFTTVGRSIVLRGKPSSKALAIARLSLDDFLGDVEVIRDGTTAATAAWATSQDQQDISKGLTEIVGKWGTEYGRLDVLTQVTDANAEELRQAAQNALEGRYPAPISISVPEGAQLAPQAPVGLEDLVCGERIDVVSTGWCTQIGQGFMISDVAVTWEGQGGEKVAVSLVPLSDPYGNPQPPPDDTAPPPGGPSPAPARS